MIEVKDNTPEVERIIDLMAIALKELTEQLGCDYGTVTVSPMSYVAGFDVPSGHVDLENKLQITKYWGDMDV